jgi:hypothetical protein
MQSNKIEDNESRVMHSANDDNEEVNGACGENEHLNLIDENISPIKKFDTPSSCMDATSTTQLNDELLTQVHDHMYKDIADHMDKVLANTISLNKSKTI